MFFAQEFSNRPASVISRALSVDVNLHGIGVIGAKLPVAPTLRDDILGTYRKPALLDHHSHKIPLLS